MENDRFLHDENDNDPKGKAVALVQIARVRDFLPEDVPAARASEFVSGYYAWELVNIRPVKASHSVLAARGIYKVELTY